MSARACPKCQRELPVETLRALERGTPCPFCATPLKRTPRLAPAVALANDGYAALQVSHTPAVIAQPTKEDSYGWFQNNGSPAVAARPAATPPPVTARAPVEKQPPPAPSPLRVDKRPPSATLVMGSTQVAPRTAPATAAAVLAAAPPSPHAERRAAPTAPGLTPPPAEMRSPLAAVAAPAVLAPAAPPPAALHLAAPPPAALPRVEPGGVAPAMTAVLPATGTGFMFSAPALRLPWRSGPSLAIAGGGAGLLVIVAFLFLHHPPPDRGAPIAAAPQVRVEAPAIQPVHPDTETAAPASAPAPKVREADAEAERGAPARVLPAGHTGSRTAHHATVHKRRYAKHERHNKRARREKRNARPAQVAASAAPASDAEARATYARGNALLFAGDASGAIAAYRKAVELAPADPIGYRGLGLAYEQRGDTGAALRALHKYLKLAPGAADREIISRRISRLSHATK